MEWVVEKYGQGKADALAAVAAVATTQIIIFTIVVVKYWEDFMVVVRGEGHIPYDHALKEQSEYFQSDQYWKDVQADEEKKEKRKKQIEKAKKKTEQSSRSLFVGYFFGDKKDDAVLTKQILDGNANEESKVKEMSKLMRSARKDTPNDKASANLQQRHSQEVDQTT